MRFGDRTTSEFIEISEEFTDSDSLLFACLSELGQNIFNIIWNILLDINTSDSWLSLWIVVEGMIEVSANLEEIIRVINIIAEIVVVDFINITLIHVCFQQDIQSLLISGDTEVVQCSQELMLGNMLVLRDVEVLEHWCQVDSLDGNTLLVFLECGIDASTFLFCHFKVLSSCLDCVINGHGSNLGSWSLLDAVRCESSVDAGTEINVIEFLISVFVLEVE